MMRILHSADWHLGLELYGESLLHYQRQTLYALGRAALDRKADALLLCGDVFDRVQAPAEAIALYDELMALFLNELKIPVYLIAGNHDAASRLGSLKSVLRRLDFHVAGRLDPFAVPIQTDDCAFFLLPHFAAEEARYYFPGEEIRSMAFAMEKVLSVMKGALVPGKANILLSHCFAAGGSPGGSDRSAQVGGSGRVPLHLFEGFDYTALGHLHAAQTLKGSVRYSGTPLPYSFSEADQKKSCTLLDTSSMQVLEIALPQPYSLVEKEGETDALIAFAEENRGSEHYYSFTLTDKSVDYASERRLRALLPHLLLLKGKPPKGRSSAGISPEELSALSPESLLNRYLQSVDDPPADEEQLGWFLQALEGGKKDASA